MARVKRGVTSHAKHKKVLEQAKGFYGRRKNTIRTAKAAVDKAGQYAYRDRKVRKRAFRALWIQRINAAARLEGFTYSQCAQRSPEPDDVALIRQRGVKGPPPGAFASDLCSSDHPGRVARRRGVASRF
eukprot:gene14256-14377_t